MSFNAKNPLIAPSIDSIPPTPPAGARGLFATPEGWKDIDSDGTVRELGGNGGMVDQTFKPESSNAQSGKAVAEALETVEIPSMVSQLENDKGYLTEHQDISAKADIIHNHSSADVIMEDEAHLWPGWTLTNVARSLTDEFYLLYECKADKSEMVGVWTMLDDLDKVKADKTVIETFEAPSFTFEFSRTNNSEMRLAEVSSISFTFGNGEYNADYISGLSFDSGATPTAIDYTDSGILNWVGTDCTNVDGLSIFQPSANTHYDIVFYFNGVQFIGLVNGFVPATGNEAV